jgi:hypothetical protein
MPSKVQCPKCNCFVTKNNLAKHVAVCDGIGPKTQRRALGTFNPETAVREEWLQPNGKYRCPHCSKEFTEAGIGGHIWRMHTEEGRAFKIQPAKTEEAKRNQGWSKGLTKETHLVIAKRSRALGESYKSGRFQSGFKGKKHSPKTLDQMSESRMQHLDKSGWAGTHHNYLSPKAGPVHLHSNWELAAAKALDHSCFDWLRLKTWFKYKDQEGTIRRYMPDFYIPLFDLYIEVKPYCPPKQQWKLDQASKQINLLVLKYMDEIKNIEESICKFVTKWKLGA